MRVGHHWIRPAAFGALAIVALLLNCSSAVAQSVVIADTVSTDDRRNFIDLNLRGRDAWYVRGFDSFFSEDDPTLGEAARGVPVRVKETFIPFVDLRIRKIWVLGREAFGTLVPDSTSAADGDPDEMVKISSSKTARFLNSLTTQTRDGIVANFLLFAEGDLIDPFELADSERLLRRQSYISDAKIEVYPLEDQPGWADIGVFVRDRWPVGAKVKIHTSTRYEIAFFHRNILGTGLNLEYEIPIRTTITPKTGHRFKTSYRNFGGSFLDADAQYKTEWSENEFRFGLNRGFAHPNLRLLGGFTAFRNLRKDHDLLPDGVALESDTIDSWVGWSFRLGEGDEYRLRRPRLVPAVRHEYVNFRSPPRQYAIDQNTWRDSNQVLGQVSLIAAEYYATSLVYSFGETEDIPSGGWLSGVGGYESTELRDRYYHAAAVGWTRFTDHQSLRVLSIGYGGFRNEGHFEDGVLDATVGGFSSLRKQRGGYWRHFYSLRYTLGINRTFEGALRLDNVALRDLDDAGVAGDHRIGAEFESILFTRYSLLGFNAAAFGYVAGGFVSDEDEAIFDERFSSNVGIGMRLNNPHLVIPTTELRAGILSTPDGFEFSFYIRMKDVNPLRRSLPSVVPSTLRYE